MVKYSLLDSLSGIRRYKHKRVPAYFTDNYQLLEGPTHWMLDVARHTNSEATIKVYGSALARFLQWYDDTYSLIVKPGDAYKKRFELWQQADIDILRCYQDYLLDVQEDDENHRPSNESINYAVTRVIQFYEWARAEGYYHWVQVRWSERKIKINRADRSQPMYKSVRKHELMLPKDRHHLLHHELTRFVDNETFALACELLDQQDPVYRWIAIVLRLAALRPNVDLSHLPFRGTEANRAFRWYVNDEIERDLRDLKAEAEMRAKSRNDVSAEMRCYKSLDFTFNSKGNKLRTIPFPGYLWVLLCQHWMPLRHERARLYAKTYGKLPPDDTLFLTKEGKPVNYHMLYEAFSKIVRHPRWPSDRYPVFTPYMLRRAWATYCVIEFAQHEGEPTLRDLNLTLANTLKLWLGHDDIRTAYDHYVQLYALIKERSTDLTTILGNKSLLEHLKLAPTSANVQSH